MLGSQIGSLLPRYRPTLTVAAAFAGAIVVAIVVAAHLGCGTRATVPSSPPSDARFLVIGKAYLPQLGAAYADAFTVGAAHLEDGEPVSDALDAISKAWSANRLSLYDKTLSPEFTKILPESVRDEDVTPAERAALAAAWRGLALGLKP